MLCKAPYMRGLDAFPCGQCMPCRINRRRLWVHRLLLEQRCHAASCFVTLTYDQAHLPVDGSLVPDHLQAWLKRLRKALHPLQLRYFACGEYGDLTWRPHYHLALFGVGVEATEVICRTWAMGNVFVGTLTPQSCAYVAGYVTKKLTRATGSLHGRYPEFARMSLRPGIGALAVPDVARVLTSEAGVRLIARDGDVPLTLQHGRSRMPLGRYLRLKLREECGVCSSWDESRPVRARREEMRELREAVGHTAFLVAKPFVERERIRQVEARAKIWAKKVTL